ncbi:hypothetical protein URH17368_0562 [Alicyclobacillus hesperidum URH17-3-68]|nr:hypothetical protein URH17368_0562 [Alicyclobacillus hesperidum URH17-3-68]
MYREYIVGWGGFLFMVVALSVFYMIAAYLIHSATSFLLYRKAGTALRWFAWIPLLGAIPYMWTIRKSAWNLLFLLIPIANIVFAIIWYVKFLNAFGKSGHWLWFILLPYAGEIVLFILWIYMAVSDKVKYVLGEPRHKGGKGNISISITIN